MTTTILKILILTRYKNNNIENINNNNENNKDNNNTENINNNNDSSNVENNIENNMYTKKLNDFLRKIASIESHRNLKENFVEKMKYISCESFGN